MYLFSLRNTRITKLKVYILDVDVGNVGNVVEKLFGSTSVVVATVVVAVVPVDVESYHQLLLLNIAIGRQTE